jgi:hypothetical protein
MMMKFRWKEILKSINNFFNGGISDSELRALKMEYGEDWYQRLNIDKLKRS